MKECEVDVLVAGGCSAGLYFAGLMARQGYKTLVCDMAEEEAIGRRYMVMHVGKHYFSQFGLPEPREGDPDFVKSFSRVELRSPFNNCPKTRTVPTLLVFRHELMRRLGDWAKKQGASLLFGASFQKPLFEKGKLAGGIFSKGGETLTVRARLTADATGFPAAVRTSLPGDYGVENFKVSNKHLSYLILRYVKLKHPPEGGVRSVITWFPYHIWMGSSNDPGPRGALIGVGSGGSYENAERVFKNFAAQGYLPEYDLDFIEKSNNCRRRCLLNFVADGFVALGDAACVINPRTGEAVVTGWRHGEIAAEEFGRVMRNGTCPEKEAVWAVNRRYMGEQGALYSKTFASRTMITQCSPEEVDVLFRNSIFFTGETEGPFDLEEQLEEALSKGDLTPERVAGMRASVSIGERIYGHYMAYPESPADFGAWEKEALSLWREADSLPGADIPY